MVDVKNTLKNLVKGFNKANRIDDVAAQRQKKVIEAAKQAAKEIQAEKA